MKRLLLIFGWILLTAGVILSGTASFHLVYSKSDADPELIDPAVIASASSTTAVPNSDQVKGVSSEVEYEDSRPYLVANFLERYNSPMEPHDFYGEKLVEIADRHNIDFRLLPAIAMQESNLCKVIPPGSYNCLGFGVHSRGTLGFESYEAGFERAAREIKANYIDIGLTTPEQIMRKYTPSSNGSWAASVNQWMAEMRYDDRSLGKKLKEDADVLEFVQAETTSNDDEIDPE
jgi:hypothetical protein